LLYRAPEKTLEAAEVEVAHGKLLDSLKKAFNVEFR
jgi:phenylalanyl-tRNA synthetase beta subunit